MAEPTDSQWQAIEAEVLAGRKIQAIKLYREATGSDLKDSKDAIDAYEAEMRKQFPEKFPAKSKGCGTAVLLLLLGAAIMALLC